MTWVVAHTNPLASILLADVRISVVTESGWVEITEFGVKKIFHVAPTVFVGFAGSIVAGFRLVDDLDRFLGRAYEATVPVSALVDAWLDELPNRAQNLIPAAVAGVRTDMIVVGMHLAPVIGESGSPTGERDPMGGGTRLSFESPGLGEATAERFSWKGAVSIGSGAEIPAYRKMLDELDWIAWSQWPEPAHVLTAIMNMTISENPVAGVSPDLTALLMKRVPGNIAGSGQVMGPLVQDRSRIAESEDDFLLLWERHTPGPSWALARCAI